MVLRWPFVLFCLKKSQMNEATFPQAGGTPSALPNNEPQTLAALLCSPLVALGLPTRMHNFAERKNLLQVADLVRLAPEALLLERNLGRTSIADTEGRIRSFLGVPWQEARALLRRQEHPHEAGPESATATNETPVESGEGKPWQSLQSAVSVDERQLPLSYFGLPTRLASFAYHQGLKTLGDLLAWPESELLAADNLGRKSIADGAARMVQVLADRRQAPDLTLATEHFAVFLRRAIAELPTQERIILTQRSGLTLPGQTLAEVGELLGISRERVRQFEAKAYASLQILAERSGRVQHEQAALEGLPLLTSARELAVPQLVPAEDQIALLAAYLTQVLQSPYRVTTLWGEPLVTKCSDAELNQKLGKLEDAATSLVYPANEGDLDEALVQRSGLTHDEVAALRPFLPFPFEVQDGRVLGPGGSRDNAMLVHMRAAIGPVSVTELTERFGRGRLPDELVWVRRGMVVLTEAVEGFALWRERIIPLTEGILVSREATRQWSTKELLPLLDEQADLPEWLNEWSLGSLYKHADDGLGPIAYLGRNVIALRRLEGKAVDGAERLHVLPLIERLLAEAGLPIAEDDLRARVEAVRGLGKHTWSLVRVRSPLVLFDDGRMGVGPRDYPFSEQATERLLAAFADALAQRERGMSVRQQREWLADYTDSESPTLHGSAWDARAFRSCLRHHPRFVLNLSGGVGLSEWESARTETQAEALRRLLREGQGRVAIATIEQELTGRDGELLLGAQWGSLAAKVGARVDGDEVVQPQGAGEGEAPGPTEDVEAKARATLSPRVIAVLDAAPSRTALLLGSMILQSKQGNRRMPSALDMLFWHRVMQAHLGCYVEAEQLARVADLAEKVQSAGEAAARRSDVECMWLATAALGYLLEQDDAKNDTALGGLDDDEAVLRVVWEAVRE
jgi:hypothetical protein